MKKHFAKDLQDYKKLSKGKYLEMNKDGKKLGVTWMN